MRNTLDKIVMCQKRYQHLNDADFRIHRNVGRCVYTEFQELVIQVPLDFLKRGIMIISESHQTFNYRQNYTNIFEKIWLMRHNSLVHTSCSVQSGNVR